MTPDNRKRRRFNWGSAIGWLIFLLVIGGRPIISLLRAIFGNTVALPANLPSLLPIVIGGLVVLSIAVAALRAIGNATSSSSPRLPTELGRPGGSPSAPMPPFGGAASRQPPGSPSPRGFALPPNSVPQQRIQPPRFDPLLNPLVLVIGIIGLLALGGLALFIFAQGVP